MKPKPYESNPCEQKSNPCEKKKNQTHQTIKPSKRNRSTHPPSKHKSNPLRQPETDQPIHQANAN